MYIYLHKCIYTYIYVYAMCALHGNVNLIHKMMVFETVFRVNYRKYVIVKFQLRTRVHIQVFISYHIVSLYII